ncbi:hypothetical protein LIER_37443 [Lithospermum erythrorhizon]|uniref:Uncharacterized protein n=1 Tax=Lithospermum erythrorhizon TaxID=34254 RepID=A0AAV3PKB6_LITER
MAFPIPGRGAKGPIFEDGPNFDLAFRLFHGQNGVVPLAGRSLNGAEKSAPKPAPPQLNPLAAKAATISLSFWGGNSKHESLGNEWLQSGNCPIAKSYRAPLPAKVLVIGALGMATNIPLGIWREHTEMFSPSWFAPVHAAVPFIAMLRKTILMPKSVMALTIAASILGQVIGSRAERYRLKAVSLQKLETIESSISGCRKEADGVQGGPAGEIVSWNKVGWQIGGVSSLV